MAKKQKVVPVEDGSLINRLLTAFEQARHIDEHGREYWLAREYSEILGYTWEGFEGVINRGKAALADEGTSVDDHFRHVSKMIQLGKGGMRDVGDIELSRRGCYISGLNGDPRKKTAIAAVQRYFVEQTRKQEINEILDAVGEDRDRLEAHMKLEVTETELKGEVASRVSRPDDHFEQIKKRGHKALFDKAPDKVKEDWGVPVDRELADFADPVIVKGMDFAASLTARQVRENQNLKGVNKIGAVNEENHKGVRRVMTDSGSFPEKMPPVGDIRDIQGRLEKQRLKLAKRNSEDRN